MAQSVRELAERLQLGFEGDGDRMVESAASLEDAGPHQISFAAAKKAVKDSGVSKAGCLVVPLEFENTAARTVIRAKDPRGSFAKIMRLLHPPAGPAPGVHPKAVIGEDVTLGSGVSIGPYAVIGRGVSVGDGTVVSAHCVIAEGCALGANCLVHPGAVIGADGFGFVFEGGRYEKFPQIGRVEIGNDVEIGANTTIDRAALGVTSIGDGTKLDNLVHIGHNCRIGKHVVMAAQCGLSGGVVVEDYAVLGGQVGVGDGATIRSGAILGGGSGVLTSKILKGGGEAYWGRPARPVREYLETLANQAKIPDLKREIEELKRRLAALEKSGA